MTESNSKNPVETKDPYLELLKAIFAESKSPDLVISWSAWKANPTRPKVSGRTLSKRETKAWISEWFENFLKIEAYEICAEIYRTKI